MVELRRAAAATTGPTSPGRQNRRITLDTPFVFDGPARGSALLRTVEDPRGVRVRGTMNNCAGGTTPWGTVLSGEENFNQYFLATGTDPREKRYGLGANQDTRNWRSVDPRWDATSDDYRNEPNRFGWIVEIDPATRLDAGQAHRDGPLQARGRQRHRQRRRARRWPTWATTSASTTSTGSSPRHVQDGRQRGRDRATTSSCSRRATCRWPGSPATASSDGVSDGTGEWMPLTRGGQSVVPGITTEQVLVYTRLAADAVQPTKMDRPEDVQPNYINGRIYVACTNNTDRGKVDKEGPTEPNPRPPTRTAMSSR